MLALPSPTSPHTHTISILRTTVRPLAIFGSGKNLPLLQAAGSMLSEPPPMTHLCRGFLGSPPRHIGLDGITERQDSQEMQGFGDSQELFDTIPVHAANPTGPNPFIP